jgi:hypothetical protein
VQTGLQEKATFLQTFGKKAVYSSFIMSPATAQLLLLLLGLLVLAHYNLIGGGSSSSSQRAPRYRPVDVDEPEMDNTLTVMAA